MPVCTSKNSTIITSRLITLTFYRLLRVSFPLHNAILHSREHITTSVDRFLVSVFCYPYHNDKNKIRIVIYLVVATLNLWISQITFSIRKLATNINTSFECLNFGSNAFWFPRWFFLGRYSRGPILELHSTQAGSVWAAPFHPSRR